MKPIFRIASLLAILLLGLLPSFAFFAWIERNTALPWPWLYETLGVRFEYPWILSGSLSGLQSMLDDSLGLRAAWDLALILLFGVIHSGLAQPGATRALERLLPRSIIRALYMVVTGLSVIALMGLWQHTGIVLWRLPLPSGGQLVLSLVLYWGLLSGAVSIVSRLGTLEFFGVAQLYGSTGQGKNPTPSGTPRLIRTGLYGRVRHPVYFFTLAAVLFAPLMSLDRMLVFAGFVLYLAWGVPLEERKLVALFGDEYLEYRKQVPAFVPRFGFRF